VRAQLALTVGLAVASCGTSGCLVSFNEASQGPCDGGSCSDTTTRDATASDTSRDRAARDTESDDHMSDATDEPEAAMEAGSCVDAPDGGTCGSANACNNAPVCIAGVCTPQPKANGTPCALPPNLCQTTPLCEDGKCAPSVAVTDGTQWKPGDDNARCCSGKEIETTTVDDCGVCNLKCNTAAGQKCTNVNDDHWFCTPCSADGDCWSGCCSETITSHCSPSDCNTGDCANPDVCPDGSHCQMDCVNYCSY
jgi:hypothetical protein